MLLYFYASLFLCFYFSIHYHVYVYVHFSFVHLDVCFVFKTLIKNQTIKNVNKDLDLVTFPYAWSYGLMDLGLETDTMDLGLWISLSSAVTLPKFCLKSLGFIPRHWFILFMCMCYFELKRSSLGNKT